MSRLLRDERAQDLVEYALLIALVAIAVIAALDQLSATIGSVWTVITTRLTS